MIKTEYFLFSLDLSNKAIKLGPTMCIISLKHMSKFSQTVFTTIIQLSKPDNIWNQHNTRQTTKVVCKCKCSCIISISQSWINPERIPSKWSSVEVWSTWIEGQRFDVNTRYIWKFQFCLGCGEGGIE